MNRRTFFGLLIAVPLVPPGVLTLTMGTDVQDDRLESTVWASGADNHGVRVYGRALSPQEMMSLYRDVLAQDEWRIRP